MLRIVTEKTGGTVTVRVEGRAIGPWVEELQRSCERALVTGDEVLVDLAGVSFVDREGVEVLRTLGTRGALVVNCSLFVAEQLKG
jgi:hypothetical protein